jgi:hypothetical protein
MPNRACCESPRASRLRCAARDGVIHGGRHALVQRHHDVRANRLLCGDAEFGTQADGAVVDVAPELGAVLTHVAAVWQGEDLEAARIGEHRAWPVHEGLDAAELFELCRPGTQQQVIGVGQQHLRAALQEVIATLATHRGMRAHRHERGRQDFVVRSTKPGCAGAGSGRSGFKLEMQAGHGWRVTKCRWAA